MSSAAVDFDQPTVVATGAPAYRVTRSETPRRRPSRISDRGQRRHSQLHHRAQSDTRLDIVAMMLSAQRQKQQQHNDNSIAKPPHPRKHLELPHLHTYRNTQERLPHPVTCLSELGKCTSPACPTPIAPPRVPARNAQRIRPRAPQTAIATDGRAYMKAGAKPSVSPASPSHLPHETSISGQQAATAQSQATAATAAGTSAAAFDEMDSPAHVHLPRPVAAVWSPACPVGRDRRPQSLQLRLTHGLTTTPVNDLRQRILASRADNDFAAAALTVEQIPVDGRAAWKIPPTPTTPFFMGNQPSSIPSGSPAADKLSQQLPHPHYSYRPRAIRCRGPRPAELQRTPASLLKRINLGSVPRTHGFSGYLDPHRAPGDPKRRDDGGPGCAPRGDSPRDSVVEQACGSADLGTSDDVPARDSMSNATIVPSDSTSPLSVSTTIRRLRVTRSSSVEDTACESDDDNDDGDTVIVPNRDGSADDTPLSPTIPAPSPLPEDSPHKYGLVDAPDSADPSDHAAPATAVSRARRRSSGLEIFNDAQTLQSASSFLNGLSASRRRAESSAIRGSDTLATAQSEFGAPPATVAGAAEPPQGAPEHYYDRERRPEGNWAKASGFVCSRPLTRAQVHCFRGHDRLLLSRNTHAPVECAVCHVDDAADHWSCSWCALRMCGHCRERFHKDGMSALLKRMGSVEGKVSGGRNATETTAAATATEDQA